LPAQNDPPGSGKGNKSITFISAPGATSEGNIAHEIPPHVSAITKYGEQEMVGLSQILASRGRTNDLRDHPIEEEKNESISRA
jgi:hypothetical protein